MSYPILRVIHPITTNNSLLQEDKTNTASFKKEDLDAQAPPNIIVPTIRTTHQYVAVTEFYEVYNIEVQFYFNF
jgi:hypothetical protein